MNGLLILYICKYTKLTSVIFVSKMSQDRLVYKFVCEKWLQYKSINCFQTSHFWALNKGFHSIWIRKDQMLMS